MCSPINVFSFFLLRFSLKLNLVLLSRHSVVVSAFSDHDVLVLLSIRLIQVLMNRYCIVLGRHNWLGAAGTDFRRGDALSRPLPTPANILLLIKQFHLPRQIKNSNAVQYISCLKCATASLNPC
jgi:hypothetical protein